MQARLVSYLLPAGYRPIILSCTRGVLSTACRLQTYLIILYTRCLIYCLPVTDLSYYPVHAVYYLLTAGYRPIILSCTRGVLSTACRLQTYHIILYTRCLIYCLPVTDLSYYPVHAVYYFIK